MKAATFKPVHKIAAVAMAVILAVGICVPYTAVAEPETNTTTSHKTVRSESGNTTVTTDVTTTVTTDGGSGATSNGASVAGDKTTATIDQATADGSDNANGASTDAAAVEATEDANDYSHGTNEPPAAPEIPANEFVNPDGEHFLGDGKGDCSMTIYYWENVFTDNDGEVLPDDEWHRALIGTYTVTGLEEGQVIDAWDCVADIPGRFFFDGWPAKLVIGPNPSQNVIDLFYGRTFYNKYTVNYYVMTGADLSANSWSGALAVDSVQFHKVYSQTFENQPYDRVILGDAYEYSAKGMYVVDTFPAQIRVSEIPDNNVLNVLYVPEMDVPPLYGELPEPGDGTGDGGSAPEHPTLPDDEEFDGRHVATILPDDFLIESTDDGDDLEVIDPDEPDNGTVGGGSTEDGVTDDDADQDGTDQGGTEGSLPDTDGAGDKPAAGTGSGASGGNGTVTEDMVTHPISSSEAENMSNAFSAGVQSAHESGSQLAKTDDPTSLGNVVFYSVLALVAVGALAVTAFVSRRDKLAAEEAYAANRR